MTETLADEYTAGTSPEDFAVSDLPDDLDDELGGDEPAAPFGYTTDPATGEKRPKKAPGRPRKPPGAEELAKAPSIPRLDGLTGFTGRTQGDDMSELEGYDFSGDPAELAAAAGHGRQRQRPMKSAMVPVRFAPEMIAAVKRFAEQDGTTVSTWIRRLVAKEIERRQPPVTSTYSFEQVRVELEAPAALSSTAPSIGIPKLILAS